MIVRNLMMTNIPTVRADTNVREVARLLTDHHMRSIPVVDDHNRVIGIVSESDLFLKEKGIPFSAAKVPTLFESWVDPKHLEEIYEAVRHHSASDVMETNVISVSPEDSIGHAAWLMMRHEFSALPVIEDDRLVGILSYVDFIRLLADSE